MLKLIFPLFALATTPAALGGTAEVRFLQPETFTDAGAQLEDERTLLALQRYVEALAVRHLPAGHVLKVEVTDVDLAGTPRPGTSLRVLHGRSDFPRIELRYTLLAPGQAALSGSERLVDLGYLQGARGIRSSDTLFHEKRMLERWFRERFSAVPPG